MTINENASTIVFDLLLRRLTPHVRRVVAGGLVAETTRARAAGLASLAAWMAEDPAAKHHLADEIADALGEPPPASILEEVRVEHATYSLLSSWSEVLRRSLLAIDSRRTILSGGLPSEVPARAQRAWGISLGQIGLSADEAGEVLTGLIREAQRSDGRIVLPWGGLIVAERGGVPELVDESHVLNAVRVMATHGRSLTVDEASVVYLSVAASLGERYEDLAQQVAKLVPRRARVVDVGAGSGIWSLMLAHSGNAEHVTGVDLPEIVALFQSTAARLSIDADLIAGDFRNLHLMRDSFDRAVLANVLLAEPLPTRRRLVQEVAHAVDDGGDILVIETDARSPVVKQAVLDSGLKIQHELRMGRESHVTAFLCSAFL